MSSEQGQGNNKQMFVVNKLCLWSKVTSFTQSTGNEDYTKKKNYNKNNENYTKK